MIDENSQQLVPRPYEPAAIARREDSVPLNLSDWEEETNLTLRDYWRIIKKRRWLILTLVSSVVTLAAIYSFKATPIYQARALVQIDKESPNVVAYKDFVAENGDNEQVALATQVKVLESRTLAHRVVDQLDLRHHPLFDPDRSNPSFKSLPETPGQMSPQEGRMAEPRDPKKESLVVDKFLKQLEVKPVRSSRIIEVTFDSPDPALATRITNSVINGFMDLNLESKYDATQKASDWLLKQSVDLKAKVEKSEEALVNYARDNQIVSIDDKQNIVTQKLADLNGEMTKAEAERIAKESIYRQIHSGSGSDVNLIRENSFIKTLSERQADLERQYADLTAKFEPGWPAALQIKSQIEEVRKQITGETQRLSKGIDAEYFTALKREQLLQRALEEQKLEANTLNQKSIQYNILKREVDTNKQLYEGLLQRLKEAGISAGLKSSNIRIVDLAEVPKDPVKPKKATNILLSLIVSLLFALGLAFGLEIMDTSLKTPDEVEQLLHLPSLAMVPSLASIQVRRLLEAKGNPRVGGKQSSEPQHVIDLISQTDARSIVSEAYRSLRTSVLLSSKSHPPKSILVSSAAPAEGKTSTTVNLGITLAQMGRRVLIIDADMRRPRIHEVFELDRDAAGLSAFLTGNAKLASLIVETHIPNLYVIPAGIVPPNPSELIGSNLMSQSLTLLLEHFDHVLIDSPPVMSVTDATILSTMVDGVVLVVHGGTTNRDAAARAAQRLRDVGARIFGTVLNNVDVKSADNGSYYQSYYYYSAYSSDESAKEKSA